MCFRREIRKIISELSSNPLLSGALDTITFTAFWVNAGHHAQLKSFIFSVDSPVQCHGTCNLLSEHRSLY